jgi:hypothetical protein
LKEKKSKTVLSATVTGIIVRISTKLGTAIAEQGCLLDGTVEGERWRTTLHENLN